MILWFYRRDSQRVPAQTARLICTGGGWKHTVTSGKPTGENQKRKQQQKYKLHLLRTPTFSNKPNHCFALKRNELEMHELKGDRASARSETLSTCSNGKKPHLVVPSPSLHTPPCRPLSGQRSAVQRGEAGSGVEQKWDRWLFCATQTE